MGTGALFGAVGLTSPRAFRIALLPQSFAMLKAKWHPSDRQTQCSQHTQPPPRSPSIESIFMSPFDTFLDRSHKIAMILLAIVVVGHFIHQAGNRPEAVPSRVVETPQEQATDQPPALSSVEQRKRESEIVREAYPLLLKTAAYQSRPNEGLPVIAEFFDYNCIYCQRMLPAIGKAIANPNVNVVLVEFPILGESSRQYAKDALAAAKQGKYIEFHEARMTDKTADSAAIAQAIGLDMQKWETDRHEEKALNTRFAGALQIAQNLRVNGTPMFIIGDRVIRGAIPPAQFDQILVRAAESVR